MIYVTSPCDNEMDTGKLAKNFISLFPLEKLFNYID